MGLLRKIVSHDTGGFVQFCKYVVVGGMSTIIQIGVFYLLATTCLRCLGSEDIVVRHFGFPSSDVTGNVRALFAAIDTAFGFTIANLFCWIMNRLFVFRPGRHVWYMELAFFFLVSLSALGVGMIAQTVLIMAFDWSTTAAVFAEILASLAINFVVRKFFVFKG